MTEKRKFNPLPRTVLPKLYRITVDSDLENFTLKGQVHVDVDVVQETKEIVLNAATITEVSARVVQNGSSLDASVSYMEEDEQVVLSLEQNLNSGEASVFLDYSGTISDDMKGYYRSPDTAHPGKFSALTQFEPVDARRAFPCWDEPSIKAQFEVTMIAEKELTVLANMHEVGCEPHPTNESKKVVKFARTPVMSTYLVAFTVGLHDFVEATDCNGVIHRVYADCWKKEECSLGLQVSTKSLEFLADFFQIRYPLPKCYNFAAQAFDFGAMENWGLVTYRSNCLLVDPKGSGGQHQQRVYEIVSHELSHQWFGNLVTMKWWTDLWLKEGFATFLQYLVTDSLRPDFQMWSQFVSNTLVSAMALDSLRNSHPIEVEVGHPSEIRGIFDDISYEKGASVNRMLFHFLGKDKFRTGLFNYLTHFSYSNAETNDLWRFLGEASGLDVESLMASWTRQTGFPVVTIESVQLTPTMRRFKLSQARHLDDGGDDELHTVWSIPISILCQSKPDTPIHHFVMRARHDTVDVEGVSAKDWVHFNPNFIGIFIVKYPKDNLELLKSAVELSPNNEILSAESRMSLIHDLLRLSISGACSTCDLLNFLSAFKHESNALVWRVIVESLERVSALIIGSNCDAEKVNQFKMSLFQSVAQKVGLEPGTSDSHLSEMLRSLIIFQMGKLAHKETVQYCNQLVTDCMEKAHPIPASIRGSVLKTFVFNAENEEQVDCLAKMYKESSNLEERRSILGALGVAQREKVVLKAIEFALSDAVTPGDKIYTFRSMAASFTLGQFLWKYLENNIDRLSSGICGAVDSRTFCDVMAAFSSPHLSLPQIHTMNEFFQKHPAARFERQFEQIKERIALDATSIQREGANLKLFFS